MCAATFGALSQGKFYPTTRCTNVRRGDYFSSSVRQYPQPPSRETLLTCVAERLCWQATKLREERSAFPNISTGNQFKPTPQLTYALWEFAKKRHVQERLRAEIMEKLGEIRSRGGDDFTADDFESMPYLLAVGKVCSYLFCLLTGVDPPLSTGNIESPPDRN